MADQPASDIVRSSLAAHKARDGRSYPAIAELIWGPWTHLDPADRRDKRRGSGNRLRDCVTRGWIYDDKIAQAWADAYGVSVETLLFHGANPR